MSEVVIPWKSLSEDALEGVIEEFVSREGTEYGLEEVPLADKIASVRRQLETGAAMILFDESTGTCNIAPADEMSSRR